MDYQYILVKSRRRTYTIKVTGDNRIIIRAPLNVTAEQVERILQSKRGWIEKVLAFNAANTVIGDEITNYSRAYVCGRLLPVEVGPRNAVTPSCVRVTGVKGFRAAYVGSLGKKFLEEFAAVERATGLKAASVKFRAYKSMWGCCDGKCNITFNFKLMMLPRTLQRYVMVHELCHTLHHDHSPQFWAAVARFLPSWKSCRAELKKYNPLVKLYQ